MYICLIISMIFFIYGFSVYGGGHARFYSPMLWMIGVLFVVLGIVIRKGFIQKMPVWSKIAGSVIVICMVILFAFVEVKIYSQLDAKGASNLDYIIVLGAKVKEDQPSSILAARCISAIHYMRENPNTVCIVSGGQGADEKYTEASVMKKYMVSFGIDEERIITEEKSMNTSQNIKNSKEIIDWDWEKRREEYEKTIKKEPSVGIVTSKFHVYRACLIAEKQGITNPSGISANVVDKYLPEYMVTEFFGVIKEWITS